jgi:hypothetical protein
VKSQWIVVNSLAVFARGNSFPYRPAWRDSEWWNASVSSKIERVDQDSASPMGRNGIRDNRGHVYPGFLKAPCELLAFCQKFLISIEIIFAGQHQCYNPFLFEGFFSVNS